MSGGSPGSQIEVTGMVLRSAPAGEYDRRVVLLTRELGRVSAFAKGARRPGSTLMAAAAPFAFGRFTIAEGRSSNRLYGAKIESFFESFRENVQGACYGSYFLEVSEYVTREGQDGSPQLLLLYQALRALENPKLSDRLTRCIFELRTVILQGEYPGLPEGRELSPAALRALQHIETSPSKGLFGIAVNEEALRQLEAWSGEVCARSLDHSFASLEILSLLAQ
ncbi:MAG: DNA repair protein RecO [Lachnospiraceae bacterium]|nr:DNA repair protein RecO [Lachnospiraceae bacterium]